MLQRGMEIGDAVNTYGLLTIGDGLVTQIPALLMAVSTGMIVTRSNAEADMGRTASAQLTQSRNALMIAGGAAIVMALIPGMPTLPFIADRRRCCCSRPSGSQPPRAQEEKTRDAEASALNVPATDPTEDADRARCASTRWRSCSPPTSSTWSPAPRTTCWPG